MWKLLRKFCCGWIGDDTFVVFCVSGWDCCFWMVWCVRFDGSFPEKRLFNKRSSSLVGACGNWWSRSWLEHCDCEIKILCQKFKRGHFFEHFLKIISRKSIKYQVKKKKTHWNIWAARRRRACISWTARQWYNRPTSIILNFVRWESFERHELKVIGTWRIDSGAVQGRSRYWWLGTRAQARRKTRKFSLINVNLKYFHILTLFDALLEISWQTGALFASTHILQNLSSFLHWEMVQIYPNGNFSALPNSKVDLKGEIMSQNK